MPKIYLYFLHKKTREKINNKKKILYVLKIRILRLILNSNKWKQMFLQDTNNGCEKKTHLETVKLNVNYSERI